MKNFIITLCILLCSIVAQAESIHFNVLAKVKLENMEEIGETQVNTGMSITVDDNSFKFSTHPKYFSVTEKTYEVAEEGNYYNLIYKDRRKEWFVCILFPKNQDEHTILIVTDANGNGYLYYVEVL